MDAGALIADLDDEQRRAVTTENQLVAVIAGAGSGKTRVLTRRVAYRVATETADAPHTLVLTFTREAAGELRRRLPRLGIEQPVTAGTFHSVCRQLLQQRWIDRGERAPTLRSDRARILREATDANDRSSLQEILAEVDIASSRGWSAADYRRAVTNGQHRSNLDTGRVTDALERYTEAKRSRHVIDLDDLLRLTVEALERDAQFADATRWKFRHLLVDEAQDLNPLQHRLIDQLRSGVDDLFMVGDPAQAIYGFTGSDPRLLLDVSKRFPSVEIIRLPTNHRSTPQVVDAGRHVLAVSGQPNELATDRDDGATVDVRRHDDEHAEARWVAKVAGAADPHLIRRGDLAVLARTHATLDATRRELGALGVPVRHLAEGANSPIAPHLRTLYRFGNPNQIREWAQDHREEVEETGDEQLGIVVQAALDFLRERPTGAGTDFEAWVDLTNPFGEQTAGVELLTFHAAKGREWNTVFLIGCETSLVPHRSATTKGLKAEEARLLYVALTRATDRLIVNWAERRNGYQRKLTPLLQNWESSVPELVPPTDDIVVPERPARLDVLDRLHAWRAEAARRADILPEHLMTDHDLSRLADEPPRSAEELSALTGIGPITSSKLFRGIAAALADH